MTAENLFIIIPAFNEEANIEGVVKQWYPIVEKIGNESKLVIINDGSKDSTSLQLSKLKNQFLHLISIDKTNSGHGSTCLFGYNFAISNNATFIFQTDSDGQTDPDEFWKFWDSRIEYDFIIGSRKSREDGLGRLFTTKVLKLCIFIMFGVYIEDANTPFRLIKTEILKKYFNLIPPDFFLSNVLMSVIFVLKKEKYKWLPISFKNRQGGINSINFRKIFKIGIQAVGSFKNLRKSL